MTLTSDPRRLFTERFDTYDRFIRTVFYPQGLRAFFLESVLLRPGLRVLDAGCGTGVVTLALRDALLRRRLAAQSFHAFDLTPAMLDRFRGVLRRRSIQDVTVTQASVLRLAALPSGWGNYDLVVSAAMLEYLPRTQLVDALTELRGQLAQGGQLVLFITRRNPLTRLLVGRWWQSNLYTARELAGACRAAGFSDFAFRRFPLRACHLSVWGHVVEARY
jgi:ubiquinone/menaquinone biosynthesis C-methylase UbiE